MANKNIAIGIIVAVVIICALIVVKTFFFNIKAAEIKVYCPEKQPAPVACTLEEHPVCAWFNQSIKCFKYPCAINAANPCMACANENVEYWTEGNCPK